MARLPGQRPSWAERLHRCQIPAGAKFLDLEAMAARIFVQHSEMTPGACYDRAAEWLLYRGDAKERWAELLTKTP